MLVFCCCFVFALTACPNCTRLLSFHFLCSFVFIWVLTHTAHRLFLFSFFLFCFTLLSYVVHLCGLTLGCGEEEMYEPWRHVFMLAVADLRQPVGKQKPRDCSPFLFSVFLSVSFLLSYTQKDLFAFILQFYIYLFQIIYIIHRWVPSTLYC